MNYTYEIDENNNVRIWLNRTDSSDPIIYQPFSPIGDAWQNPEEATAWAESMIVDMTAAAQPLLES